MNLIKYIRNKNECPECNHDLVKNPKSHEIYCNHCGLLVLDDFPVTNHLIDIGLSYETPDMNAVEDLVYVGTVDGVRRYI